MNTTTTETKQIGGERPLNLLTKQQAADLLRVCKRSIDNWQKDGLIAYYKFGRICAYDRDDLIDFVNRSRIPAKAAETKIKTP